MLNRLIFFAVIFALFGFEILAKESSYIVDPAKTYFAVITGKEGWAKAAAHEHVVVAKNYESKLEIDEKNPEKSSFNLVIPTKKLNIDDPSDQKAVFEILKKLKLREEPFKALDAKDMKEVRISMLSKEQLDGENFDKISLKTTKITKDKEKNIYHVNFEMKIKNKTSTKSIDALVSSDNGSIRISGHAKIKFSDFDIKRYTAFLGAVKVSDEFILILDLSAKKKP